MELEGKEDEGEAEEHFHAGILAGGERGDSIPLRLFSWEGLCAACARGVQVWGGVGTPALTLRVPLRLALHWHLPAVRWTGAKRAAARSRVLVFALLMSQMIQAPLAAASHVFRDIRTHDFVLGYVHTPLPRLGARWSWRETPRCGGAKRDVCFLGRDDDMQMFWGFGCAGGEGVGGFQGMGSWKATQ